MEFIPFYIIAMTPSAEVPGKFVVVLESENRDLRLPIVIGESEAMAIGLALERIKLKRPMTHDLMLQMMQVSGQKLLQICIHGRQESIYIASIKIQSEGGDVYEIDARPSDCLALAVRSHCPIYVCGRLMEEVGLKEDIYATAHNRIAYSEYTIEELELLLKNVLAKEDYHSAIRIKDSIERKKKQDNKDA